MNVVLRQRLFSISPWLVIKTPRLMRYLEYLELFMTHCDCEASHLNFEILSRRIYFFCCFMRSVLSDGREITCLCFFCFATKLFASKKYRRAARVAGRHFGNLLFCFYRSEKWVTTFPHVYIDVSSGLFNPWPR